MKLLTPLCLILLCSVSTGYCQESDLLGGLLGTRNNAIDAAGEGTPAQFDRSQSDGFISPPQSNPLQLQRNADYFNRDLQRQQNLGQSRDQILLLKGTEQLRKAKTDEEKAVAKAGIKKLLESQYDDFLDVHRNQLDQMRKKFVKLEEQLKRRRDAKSRLVKLKLDMLVNQAEGLGWPGDPVPIPNWMDVMKAQGDTSISLDANDLIQQSNVGVPSKNSNGNTRFNRRDLYDRRPAFSNPSGKRPTGAGNAVRANR
jgi:hypothetical protein